MKTRALFILALFISTTIGALGQGQTPIISQLKLPQIAPPSPDAAAIEKYGNFPVTYSSGVPNISIPLWTVQCGSVSWPISISYNAGGIKVDESASIIGLGWSLGGGPGVITRSVNGRADEETSAGEPASFENVTDANYAYLYSAKEGTADSELDLFNFSFNGRSGKFVIAHDASGTVIQVPQSNLKITHDAQLNYFIITDDLGIVYTFDQKEHTTTSGNNTSVTNKTAWYLTKIELPDKNNVIQFSFSSAGPTADTYNSFTQTIGRKYVPDLNGLNPTLELISEPVIPSSSLVSVSSLKLTGITFPNGSVAFNYDAVARQDLGGGNNVYNKLTSIVINEVVNGASTVLKTFRFGQSYFQYTPSGWTSAPQNYRLRLDNLIESSTSTSPALKQHTFQYNLTANLSPRGSNGQDVWGFNNGLTSNTNLLQTETVSYNDGTGTIISATVGNANRSVNAVQMEAWMLTSITYPTGGKTVFDYEPHVYATDFSLAVPKSFTATITASNLSDLEDISTFTYPSANLVVPGTTRLLVDMSKIDFPGVTQPSVVVLRNVTLGQDVYVLSQPRQYERYQYEFPINLTSGNQYQLKATLYTNQATSQLNASISVRWSESTAAPDIRTGGGLRIKEMIHYTNATTISGKEAFVYDTAVTLTPFHLINTKYKDVTFRLGIPSGTGCAFHYSPVCRVYHSQSIYALTNALGSPMLYRRIQKLDVDPATGTPKGKSEFVYDVFQDPTIPVGGPLALGAHWANGFLISETHYKYTAGTYDLIKKTENEYNAYNSTRTVGLRVEPKLINEGCEKMVAQSNVFEDIRYYTVDLPTASKRLSKQVVTEVDEFDRSLVKTTTNYYTSLDYEYPTAVVTVDSKNTRDSVTYRYSPDFATGTNNVYDKMEAQNIKQPLIEQVAYSGGTKLSTLKNNYRDWLNNGKVLALDTVQASIYNNALETRLRYFGYDAYANPLAMARDNDITNSFIWAYSNAKPIAQAINAPSNSIAYTSFETSESGGWTGISAAGLSISGSVTGVRALTQNNFNISKSGLGTTTSYVISYWSKNGSYTVNSTSGTAGRTVNGWTFYSHTVTPSTGTVSVTGTGAIDELRLYPAVNAHMVTYTYEPMGGVSSVCDANNKITYYEYDELQRPILIRDQDRNILKKFSYNYSGVTEYPSIHYNTAQSVTRQKQGCTGCQIGSSITYTVPANTYVSTEGVSQANTLALAEASANAQAYANANGSCITPTAASVTGTNQITNNGFSVKFHNNCTNVDYTYSLAANANITLSPAPPIGNYNVTFTKMFGPGNYTYSVNTSQNSYLTTTTTDPTFSNVEVGSTGNLVKIQP